MNCTSCLHYLRYAQPVRSGSGWMAFGACTAVTDPGGEFTQIYVPAAVCSRYEAAERNRHTEQEEKTT